MCVWLSENRLGSEDILLEEAMLNEFLQVPSEGPTVDGFVSLALVLGAIFLRSGERRIMLGWFRLSGPRLIFEGIETLR